MGEHLPWQEGVPILSVVRDWVRGGGELVLPDEPEADPTQIRWSPGSGEGVAGHHFGGGGEDAGVVPPVRRLIGGRRAVPDQIVSRLRRLVDHPGEEERLRVYRICQNRRVLLEHVDAVLERVVADPGLLAAVAPHARWLATEARHRGPVTLGTALLGVAGADEDVEALKALAAHDDFTFDCVVALTNLLADPADALWEVARQAQGWGKVEAVERLAERVEGRPEIKRWLLTDGCAPPDIDEDLAFACATRAASPTRSPARRTTTCSTAPARSSRPSVAGPSVAGA